MPSLKLCGACKKRKPGRACVWDGKPNVWVCDGCRKTGGGGPRRGEPTLTLDDREKENQAPRKVPRTSVASSPGGWQPPTSAATPATPRPALRVGRQGAGEQGPERSLHAECARRRVTFDAMSLLDSAFAAAPKTSVYVLGSSKASASSPALITLHPAAPETSPTASVSAPKFMWSPLSEAALVKAMVLLGYTSLSLPSSTGHDKPEHALWKDAARLLHAAGCPGADGETVFSRVKQFRRTYSCDANGFWRLHRALSGGSLAAASLGDQVLQLTKETATLRRLLDHSVQKLSGLRGRLHRWPERPGRR